MNELETYSETAEETGGLNLGTTKVGRTIRVESEGVVDD